MQDLESLATIHGRRNPPVLFAYPPLIAFELFAFSAKDGQIDIDHKCRIS
jgi:hypothetical protein